MHINQPHCLKGGTADNLCVPMPCQYTHLCLLILCRYKHNRVECDEGKEGGGDLNIFTSQKWSEGGDPAWGECEAWGHGDQREEIDREMTMLVFECISDMLATGVDYNSQLSRTCGTACMPFVASIPEKTDFLPGRTRGRAGPFLYLLTSSLGRSWRQTAMRGEEWGELVHLTF